MMSYRPCFHSLNTGWMRDVLQTMLSFPKHRVDARCVTHHAYSLNTGWMRDILQTMLSFPKHRVDARYLTDHAFIPVPSCDR